MQPATPRSQQIAKFRTLVDELTQRQAATDNIVREQSARITQLVENMAHMQGQLDALKLAHSTHTHSFTQVTAVNPMIDFPTCRGVGGAPLPARSLDLTPENSNGRAFLQVVNTPSQTSKPQ